jgi:tRNA (guanine37-N1)-methyltransferase
MQITFITLFPDNLKASLEYSMLFNAIKNGILKLNYIDLRQFGSGPRKQIDDKPYGGGPGMLLKPEPIFSAVEEALKLNPGAKVFLPTPSGEKWNQAKAQKLADQNQNMIIICPHYEGYDQRILSLVDEQFCIGEYVLTGGELPAAILADSVARLLPGVLGGEDATENESFGAKYQLEHPQYTRPEEFRGQKVPEVLLSGNHAEIEKWKQDNSKSA